MLRLLTTLEGDNDMWKDSETNIDLLDFDYLVNVAKKIILNDKLTPSSIGIYGDWGSGKSSLMDMVMTDLSKEDDVLCIKFNGWLFEGYEDAKIALIGTILDEIGKERNLVGKAKKTIKNLYENTDFIKLTSKFAKYGIDFLLTGGILSVTDITIETIKEAIAAKGKKVDDKDIESVFKAFKSKEVRRSVQKFHEEFKSLLKETNIKRLVVFIDELDRCKPDTILETFEAIRLFLFAEGTSFVIGADERQIQYAVQTKYPTIEGNQIDIGKEYLEKLIQYPVRIPQLGEREVEFYIMCLFFENELGKDISLIKNIIMDGKTKNFLDFELTYELIREKSEELAEKLKDTISLSKQISSVLAKGLNGNPRHCKRFLNAMDLRTQMAQYRRIVLDRKMLAKIMLVEYFKPSFYKLLAELQANDNGKSTELASIETEEWDKAENLKLWKDDVWVKNWITIEPKLGQADLRPYFYFSRESIRNTSFVKTPKLSIEAAKILDNLLSRTDTKRKDAIQSALNLSDFEALTVHKEITAKLETSSEIDRSIFQSFIEWGSARQELHIETIAVLGRLSVDKIKLSFIPFITPFANKLNDKATIIELLNKWKSQNKSFTCAIDDEVKKIKSK
ncbi:MAG: KAP family NTPase [Tannerella sp.]|jgi:predicted KAP-like P-loop ATPase|nr:KAP family NTPase [Tannerella sp.]